MPFGTDPHPYDVGDKVWITGANGLARNEGWRRATVTGIGWEHERPKILVKLDEDAAHEDPRVRTGSYKFGARSPFVQPVSAVELLGEVADAAD